MRQILLLLIVALFATTASNAQTKKRIFINLNVSKAMERGYAEQAPSYAQYLSAGKSEYIAPASNRSPVYIAAADPVRAAFRPELDQSDSATTIKSKVNPAADFVFTGLYDFPYRATIGNIGQIIGLAQFIPPMKGNFVIDTIVMVLFKPTSNGAITNPVLNDVLLYPVTVSQNIKTFSSIFVRSFDQNLENFIGDEPIAIKADTINTRVQNSQIKYVILPTKQLTIPAGSSSAFMLRPQSTKDTMRWLGSFEWGVQSDSRIYGAYITRPAGVANDKQDSLLRALSIGFYQPTPDFAAAFPSLVNKGFRTNYSMILGGTYDGDDDPNETYANQSGIGTSVEEIGGAQPLSILNVSPNPITETGKMTFSLDRASNVEISIVNTIGQTVAVIAKEYMQSGTFSADIDASFLANGMYNIVLNAGGARATAPLSIVR